MPVSAASRSWSNAGGLNPPGLAAAARALYERLGLKPRVAHIEGDDLMPQLAALQARGERFTHLDKGIPLCELRAPVLTANAYLGGWGIADALERGADRRHLPARHRRGAGRRPGGVAVRLGARRLGSARAGASPPATSSSAARSAPAATTLLRGGAGSRAPGFPIAEMHADGSFVITKHPGTGGLVSSAPSPRSCSTRSAAALPQPRRHRALRHHPARRRTAPIACACHGVRGEPPPPTTKVCINTSAAARTG